MRSLRDVVSEAGSPPAPHRTVERCRDVLFTLSSLAVHDLLVVERGWSEPEYEAWLADALAGELLGRG